jgi:hypothetical protein
MAVTSERFAEEVRGLVAERRAFWDHPFISKFRRGELGKDQVRHWIEQQFYLTGRVHDLIGPLGGRDPEAFMEDTQAGRYPGFDPRSRRSSGRCAARAGVCPAQRHTTVRDRKVGRCRQGARDRRNGFAAGGSSPCPRTQRDRPYPRQNCPPRYLTPIRPGRRRRRLASLRAATGEECGGAAADAEGLGGARDRRGKSVAQCRCVTHEQRVQRRERVAV